ncbi:MAG TPA: hypothetical protein VFQ00_12685 [Terriglobales bacterium]|nr:hypothetical protein [Terriglobales bacterium]
MWKRIPLLASVLLMLANLGQAQAPEPIPAPDDILFQFQTQSGQTRFHLGETIPVTFTFSSSSQGQYVFTDCGAWHRPMNISCSPATDIPIRSLAHPEFNEFERMLSPCLGPGWSDGYYGCAEPIPLGVTPVRFPAPLSRYVRFSAPGRYACVATSTQVGKIAGGNSGPPLMTKSEPLTFEIVDDPNWSHAAAEAYDQTYAKFCRTDDLKEAQQQRCFDIADRIANLDTIESLATEIKYFDGKQHSWDNGFWTAILATSYPTDGLRLLSERMQAADFQVSAETVKLLAIWDLKAQTPDAFSGAAPALYHEQAVAVLRRYVRLFGRSLRRKKADNLGFSANTYHEIANQQQCGSEPLISQEEQEQTLSAAGLTWDFSRNGVDAIGDPDRHP